MISCLPRDPFRLVKLLSHLFAKPKENYQKDDTRQAAFVELLHAAKSATDEVGAALVTLLSAKEGDTAEKLRSFLKSESGEVILHVFGRNGSRLMAEIEAKLAPDLSPWDLTPRLHAENLKFTPTIPGKTIICHIVADSILPAGQRNMLKALEQEMRNKKYSEKVVSLSVKDPGSPEDFMKELERIKAREEARYPGYKIRFDVACPGMDLVGRIQASGIQALAFSKEGDGDIVQVEGIILALRALQTGSIDSLLKAYKFLTGKDLAAGTHDINELARMILFILPVTKVDVDQIGKVNRIIEENIKTAA